MNRMDNTKFIKKIIEYSLSDGVLEVLKQLETYFKVNNYWNKTVVNYLDHIWNEKDMTRSTIWYYAVGSYGIKSEEFWKVIAQKNSEWFDEFWAQKNYFGDTVWHEAMRHLESKKFWEIIAQKPNSFFKSWDLENNNGNTVWDHVEIFMGSNYKSKLLEKKNKELLMCCAIKN
jgi:hypothetical protein